MKSRRLRSKKLSVKHKIWYEAKALILLLFRLFFIYIVTCWLYSFIYIHSLITANTLKIIVKPPIIQSEILIVFWFLVRICVCLLDSIEITSFNSFVFLANSISKICLIWFRSLSISCFIWDLFSSSLILIVLSSSL